MLENAYNALYTITFVVLIVLDFLCLIRAIRGPRVADRIVAINMISTITIGIIMVLIMMLGQGGLADVALIYALIGFLAVVVLCKVYMGIALESREKKKEAEKNSGVVPLWSDRRVCGCGIVPAHHRRCWPVPLSLCVKPHACRLHGRQPWFPASDHWHVHFPEQWHGYCEVPAHGFDHLAYQPHRQPPDRPAGNDPQRTPRNRNGDDREMNDLLLLITLIFLVVCAIATCLTRNLLASVIIFMAYSVLMSIVWMLLQSPDLAITEAAVGAGVTTVLFFVTLKKIHAIKPEEEDHHENQ